MVKKQLSPISTRMFVHDQESALKASQMLNEELQDLMEKDAKERARREAEEARKQAAAREAVERAAREYAARIDAERDAEAAEER